ncbi:hypothetical protein HDU98_001202 [Podochytrium sp. JEL0797]|nr:hypothetical protein HDU98_001202 [Podochytrium sp. JEL0797]
MDTSPLFTVCAGLGALALAHTAMRLGSALVRIFVVPGKSLASFGVAPGTWAVVTGASSGIGFEFASQLAAKGVNVLLVARSQERLEQAKQAMAPSAAKGAQLRTCEFDFAKATNKDFARLTSVLAEIDANGGVAMLVNNAATNHDIPVPFMEESSETCNAIVQVNISSQLDVTRLVLPFMLARKKGLILNMGSLAGIVPSPLLSIYSGGKAFLRFWSNSLAAELKPQGIHVQHLRAFFVVSNMSKIRKASWTTPTAKEFVKAALGKLGNEVDSTPYPSHALLMWVIENSMGESFWTSQSNRMHIDIRKRALKKREREAAAVANGVANGVGGGAVAGNKKDV